VAVGVTLLHALSRVLRQVAKAAKRKHKAARQKRAKRAALGKTFMLGNSGVSSIGMMHPTFVGGFAKEIEEGEEGQKCV